MPRQKGASAILRQRERDALILFVLSLHTRTAGNGYHYVYAPWFHRSGKDGWAKRADIVAAISSGRLLELWEIAHHKDENKENDSPDNIELMDYGEHSSHELATRWRRGKMDAVRKQGRWSLRFDSCRDCQGTDRRYQGHGLCSLCYQKRLRANLPLSE